MHRIFTECFNEIHGKINNYQLLTERKATRRTTAADELFTKSSSAVLMASANFPVNRNKMEDQPTASKSEKYPETTTQEMEQMLQIQLPRLPTQQTTKLQTLTEQQPTVKTKRHKSTKIYSTISCEGYNIEQRNCNTFECSGELLN